MSLPNDWGGIENFPHFNWAALPPTMLDNCLPNGECFARHGTATIGGNPLAVAASGARTMVMTLLLRSLSAPFGEVAIMAAFKQAGLTGANLSRPPEKCHGR